MHPNVLSGTRTVHNGVNSFPAAEGQIECETPLPPTLKGTEKFAFWHKEAAMSIALRPALAALCIVCLLNEAAAFMPLAVPAARLRRGLRESASARGLRATADEVSRRTVLASGIAAAAVTLATP